MTRRKVLVTANFDRNLDELEAFRQDHPAGLQRLMQKLDAEVLPLLRQQANVGRLYAPGQQPRPLIERIRARLGGGVLREFLVEDCLVLYLVGESQVALLSIRHERELGYDFGD